MYFYRYVVITATNRNVQNLNDQKPKRPQTETTTGRNGHKPKWSQTGTATTRNGHKPKRPQTEMQTGTATNRKATNRNGHKPERPQITEYMLFRHMKKFKEPKTVWIF